MIVMHSIFFTEYQDRGDVSLCSTVKVPVLYIHAQMHTTSTYMTHHKHSHIDSNTLSTHTHIHTHTYIYTEDNYVNRN